MISFADIKRRFRKFFPRLFIYVHRFILDILGFLFFLISYILKKTSLIPSLLLTSYFLLLNSASSLKFYLTAKLIWGRGRLFRVLSHFGIISMALVIIISGGFLSGTSIVRKASGFAPTDYLTQSDVLKSNPSTGAEITGDRPRNQPIDYIVASGDTISTIGQLFHVSVDAITYANNLSDEDIISPGQKLIIPPVEGVIYQIKRGDTLDSIAAKFKAPAQSIAEFNYIFDNRDLIVGQKIIVPEAQIPSVPKNFVPPPLASRTPLSPVPMTAYNEAGRPEKMEGSTGALGWPLNSRSLSQYFTNYHLGIDITGKVGDPIFASDGGVVLRAGWWLGGFGNAVKIDHGNGYTTAYAHMSRILVSVGQTVRKGQVIGEVGSTGRSTGPHLHFAVQQGGRYLNPLAVF